MTTTMRRPVSDMSGWCRHSGHHELCHAVWTTPSAEVTCSCACHKAGKATGGVVVKKMAKPGVVVKKKLPTNP